MTRITAQPTPQPVWSLESPLRTMPTSNAGASARTARSTVHAAALASTHLGQNHRPAGTRARPVLVLSARFWTVCDAAAVPTV